MLANDKYKRNILHWAAGKGCNKTVQQLYFVQVNLEERYLGTLQALLVATGKFKRTALQQAAERVRGAVVLQLLDFVQGNLEDILVSSRPLYWLLISISEPSYSWRSC